MDRDRKLAAVGSYKLTGKILGKGNFATVYEAIHSVLRFKVAIKAIDKSRLQQHYVIKNMRREAKILFRLNHPCVLRLYETIQYQDYYYLVTEVVPGGDLNTYISTQPNEHLIESQTQRFAAQLFSAIDHLHKNFVVHRDLKLENILVDRRKDWIKLIDFGLSNVWNRHSMLITNCGSPEYAAPELFIEGTGYGPEVDLWSLGVVLYVMATGKLPFRVRMKQKGEITPSEHRTALFRQISRGLTPRHYRSINNYSQEFIMLLENLLVPNSNRRINLATAMKYSWIKKNIPSSNWKTRIHHHVKILEEISNMTNKNLMEVTTALEFEPYGKIGGLYNIMSHNRMLKEHQCGFPNVNVSSNNSICSKV